MRFQEAARTFTLEWPMPPQLNPPRFRADGRRAADLWSDGSSYAEIALALDISQSLVANWLRRLRETDPTIPTRRPGPWTKAEDEQLKQSHGLGLTAEEIARKMGRGPWGVERRIATLKLRTSYGDAWSPHEDEHLERSFRAGDSVASMSVALDRTPGQVDTRLRYLRKIGRELPPRKPRWTAPERERLAARYREGATYQQLAAEFGKAKGTVSRQLRQMRDAGMDLDRQ